MTINTWLGKKVWYIYIHIHLYIHLYMHKHTNTHICIYTHVCVYMYVYVHVHICTYIDMSMHMYLGTQVCLGLYSICEYAWRDEGTSQNGHYSETHWVACLTTEPQVSYFFLPVTCLALFSSWNLGIKFMSLFLQGKHFIDWSHLPSLIISFKCYIRIYDF